MNPQIIDRTRDAALALVDTIKSYRLLKESGQSNLDPVLQAELKALLDAVQELPTALAPTTAEKLGQHVLTWATKSGWKPEDGEGAFEYVKRLHYAQGLEDARPYWARAYKEQEDFDAAVAQAIETVAQRVESGLATGTLPKATADTPLEAS